MTERMPLLFVDHGSPMDMILDDSFAQRLARRGKCLPPPRDPFLKE